jgi:hypothetical protein
MIKKNLLKLFFAAFLSFFAITSFAKSVALYDSPNEKARIISKVVSDAPLLIIYQSKKGEWIKVANPQDGDVGWVEIKNLSGPLIKSSINKNTISQQIITKDGKSNSYQIFEYNKTKKLSPDEVRKRNEALLREFHRQQQDMEESMEKIHRSIQGMMRDMQP